MMVILQPLRQQNIFTVEIPMLNLKQYSKAVLQNKVQQT